MNRLGLIWGHVVRQRLAGIVIIGVRVCRNQGHGTGRHEGADETVLMFLNLLRI